MKQESERGDILETFQPEDVLAFLILFPWAIFLFSFICVFVSKLYLTYSDYLLASFTIEGKKIKGNYGLISKHSWEVDLNTVKYIQADTNKVCEKHGIYDIRLMDLDDESTAYHIPGVDLETLNKILELKGFEKHSTEGHERSYGLDIIFSIGIMALSFILSNVAFLLIFTSNIVDKFGEVMIYVIFCTPCLMILILNLFDAGNKSFKKESKNYVFGKAVEYRNYCFVENSLVTSNQKNTIKIGRLIFSWKTYHAASTNFRMPYRLSLINGGLIRPRLPA